MNAELFTDLPPFPRITIIGLPRKTYGHKPLQRPIADHSNANGKILRQMIAKPRRFDWSLLVLMLRAASRADLASIADWVECDEWHLRRVARGEVNPGAELERLADLVCQYVDNDKLRRLV